MFTMRIHLNQGRIYMGCQWSWRHPLSLGTSLNQDTTPHTPWRKGERERGRGSDRERERPSFEVRKERERRTGERTGEKRIIANYWFRTNSETECKMVLVFLYIFRWFYTSRPGGFTSNFVHTPPDGRFL